MKNNTQFFHFSERNLCYEHGMLEWITHSSMAIKGFPMGDPHERIFPVYLPPDYDAKQKEPYPVIYLLAGWSGRSSHYVANDSIFGTPLHIRFDRAISEKRMPSVIVVFPDGSSKLGCSQYVNSPAIGNYMDYLCDELVPFVDKRYHTHASADFRGLGGHSSGGFGALVTGLLRPEIFKFICSSAGDSFYEVSLLANIKNSVMELDRAGGVEEFIKEFLSDPNPLSSAPTKVETMLTLSMAPCYAPDISRPQIFGNLFFDTRTGRVLPEIWKKYMAWDPVHMLDSYASNAKKLKYILLEAGLQDEYSAQWGHRQIAEGLKKLNVTFEINEYPGKHGGHHWRFESRLTKMLSQMFA